MTYKSIRGSQFGYDDYSLILRGTRIGGGWPAALGRGKIVFVDSTIDASDGGSPDSAVGTLGEVFSNDMVVANHGDTVIMLPNHAETITGAGGLTMDIAGVSVYGLGNYNQRPRLLMDGATSVTALVSGADIDIHNIEMASGHLLVATGFDVTAKGCWLDQIKFNDNTTAENWGSPVKATGAANTADGLKITGCRWTPLVATVNALEFLEITDDIRDLIVAHNFIVHEGTASPLVLQAGSKVMQTAHIIGNHISHKMTSGDLLIDNGGSTNSGIVAYNFCGNADVSGAQAGGAATGLRFFENYYTSTAVDSGAIEPAADTPLS